MAGPCCHIRLQYNHRACSGILLLTDCQHFQADLCSWSDLRCLIPCTHCGIDGIGYWLIDDGGMDTQYVVNTMCCLIKIDYVDYSFTIVILDSLTIHLCYSCDNLQHILTAQMLILLQEHVTPPRFLYFSRETMDLTGYTFPLPTSGKLAMK